MAGGANDERLAVLHAEVREGQGGFVEAEINDGIGLVQQRAEMLAEINRADDLDAGNVRGARDERLAHAAFRASDDDFGHERANCV